MIEDPSRKAKPLNVPPDWEALARFLAGESAPDEATRVEQWLDANPQDRELVRGLDAALVLEPANVDVEPALRSVHARLGESTSAPRLTVERGRDAAIRAARPAISRRSVFVMTLVAAAAAAFAVIFVRSSHDSSPPNGGRVYTTAIGHRGSFLLADGSRVMLGPDSRLTVAADYGVSSRSVELKGDGYFDVRHDSSKPFAVRVGRAIVEDIGTTFTIESDAADTTNVSVLSGSVRLRADGSTPSSGAVLAAGDRGSLAPDGQVRAFPHTVNDDAAWTTGRLVFRDASLARVAAELHRWYGVELQIADSALLKRTVNTTFNGEPIDQMLKIIELTLGGVRVERHGDSATVSLIRGQNSAR
jgi:transmembrane sensor